MFVEPQWIIFTVFHVALQLGEASPSPQPACRKESSTCHCGSGGSLRNILTLCCQNDVFHVHINRTQLSIEEAVFNQMPCHNIIDFRVHAPIGRTVLAQAGASFNGLPNLEELHITGDRSLYSLPSGAFANTGVNLRVLNLSRNSLAALSGGELGGLGVQELDLSHNHLQQIRSGSFLGLYRLRRLNLAGNRINEIGANMFEGLEALEELDLRSNPIREVFGGAFQRLSKLRHLLISGSSPENSFRGLLTPGMLYGLQELRQLTLSGLQITGINAETFMNLRHLQDLDLSHNALAEVPHTAFNRMALAQRTSRLRRLDLSHNRIRCLPEGAFSKFPKLESLDLSGNKLTVVSGQAFHGMLKIRELNMLDNPIVAVIPGAFESFENVKNDGNGESNRPTVSLPPLDVSGAVLMSQATVDATCPSIHLAPTTQGGVQLKQSNFVATVDEDEGDNEESVGNFLSRNKVSVIVIAICVILTLIVTSATILSCQNCRRRRRQQQRKQQLVVADGAASPLAPALSDAGKSFYSVSSADHHKQAATSSSSYYCTESFGDKVNSASFSSLPPVSASPPPPPSHLRGHEKISLSERLFSLAQQNLAPPPYPHTLPTHTMEGHLRQVVANGCAQQTALLASTYHQPTPANYSSGHSSPSNPGSSPRFSYSTASSARQQQPSSTTLHVSAMVMVGDDPEGMRGDKVMMPPCPPASISPLHESGIGSDNASSSLVAGPPFGIF